MKFRLGIFLLLFFIWGVSAQEYNDFITGVLLDSESREPVVFATIRIKGKALGVISNQDGGFKIPTDFQNKGEILEISSMGYKTKDINFYVLKRDSVNLIFVEPALFALNETVVTANIKRLTARKIIKRALKRIPLNYPHYSFNLTGYYRDYQLKEKEYINLNEAIVEVFDKGFQSDDYQNTEYGLYNYKKNEDFKVDSFAARPYDYKNGNKFIPDASLISDYGGNELVILHIHDAIRNYNVRTYSYVNKLVDDFIKTHRFTSVENTSYGDEAVYKIGIKKNAFPFQVEGAIYIDKDDYAIRKLDYRAFKQPINESNLENPANNDSKTRQLVYEILVEYSEMNGKMYLNYISFHNKFTVRRPPVFRVYKITLDKENNLLGIELNKPATNYNELELSDISLTYQGKKIQLKKIVKAVGNKILLQLSTNERQVTLRNELFSTSSGSERGKLFLQIKVLKDDENNLLDERKLEHLDQFREFFAQKVENSKAYPISEKSNFMLKTKPLYAFDQRKFDSKMKNDYWMNTPLKNVNQ